MNKPTLSLSEIAHRIVLERKFDKIVAEVNEAMKSMFMLSENLPGGIDQGILKVSKDVENAGEDVADPNVQAAMLQAALKKGGDVSKVTATDVEAAMSQGVKETKRPLNESENPVIAIIEAISVVLGNAALVEEICGVVEKITGKKIDPSSFVQGANKVAGFMKKVTGFPMKVLGNAVAWIIGKLGGGETAQKIGKYSVKFIIVAVMFIIGLKFFPIAGASMIGITMSVTAMIGKGFELFKLGKEIFKAVKAAMQGAGGASPAPAMA